jgi:putative FmdB family regulatory protein
MPLYAYRCKSCDHQFERHQRMTDQPLQECPVCAGDVRRLISNVGVVFKGSGFYITDNRNGANGNGAKKGETVKGSEKKSESETTAEKKSTSDSSVASSKGATSTTSSTAAAD